MTEFDKGVKRLEIGAALSTHCHIATSSTSNQKESVAVAFGRLSKIGKPES